MKYVTVTAYLFFALLLLSMPAPSFAQIGISVSFGPPPIPLYDQPICPGDGYIWTPGYWAWDGNDYYWVPGTWVLPPEIGFFWTPGYWAWEGAGFFFHEGYWGPQVGFYGGINYGFGYFGHGYEGGRWDRGHFFYNRLVNNVDTREIHDVYSSRILYNNSNRVSYNGGNGGINERPSSAEEAFSRERHVPPVAMQTQHAEAARANGGMRASANQGRPPVAATQRPGEFNDHVVAAEQAGGRYRPSPGAGGGENAARTPAHVNELPPLQQPSTPNTGNRQLDQRYQQQQQKLYTQQNQERQRVLQQQEAQHQGQARQNAPPQRAQQVEQQHQQQTQQLQQRQVQQQQQLQQRQAPPRQSGQQRGRR